jgi:HD-like signal output (HDOD) protein
LRSPTASAAAVGELVEKDLAISTKLIQVVNSAFYGLAQQVTDPAAAVPDGAVPHGGGGN